MTLGGAMRMNAGANGGDIASILVEAQLLDSDGNVRVLSLEQLGLAYRQSRIPAGWVLVAGTFVLQRGDSNLVRDKMRKFNTHRRNSQPLNHASAGSTFKNPPDGVAAWQLIQDSGLRGLRVGDAQVSEKHCNFLVNRGQAKSCDMLALIDTVREQVVIKTGVALNLEVAILGPSGFRSSTVVRSS